MNMGRASRISNRSMAVHERVADSGWEIACPSTSGSFPPAQLGAQANGKEVRFGKGQGIRASLGDLYLAGCVPECRARVCARGAGRLGILQAAAGGALEEALMFRVEAVPESEALAWQQEAVLLVEDLFMW